MTVSFIQEDRVTHSSSTSLLILLWIYWKCEASDVIFSASTGILRLLPSPLLPLPLCLSTYVFPLNSGPLVIIYEVSFLCDSSCSPLLFWIWMARLNTPSKSFRKVWDEFEAFSCFWSFGMVAAGEFFMCAS